MTNLTANLQIDEKLDWISEAKTLDEQVARTKQVAQMDATFATLMRMAVTEKEKLCGLPAGVPSTYKPKTDVPNGTSLTTVRQELRRLKNYLSDGSYKDIPGVKREGIWLGIIEGLHWKEATILTHIKDQTLLVIYPNMREVLMKLGAPISVPDNVPAKKMPSRDHPRRKL
jgi:hypothetical protein